MRKIYNIEIDCPACALKCESVANKIAGVLSCKIDYISQKMILESDDIDGVYIPVIKAIKKKEPDFEVLD